MSANGRARLGRELMRALWLGDAPGGNYTEQAQRLVANAGPGVAHVDIAHDEWCAIWRRLPCNCEPIVSLRGDS